MAKTNVVELPSKPIGLCNSGSGGPRLRPAKDNWRLVPFCEQYSRQQEYKHHCHGIATLKKSSWNTFHWLKLSSLCVFWSLHENYRRKHTNLIALPTPFWRPLWHSALEPLLQGFTSYLKGYCYTWHLDSYLPFYHSANLPNTTVKEFLCWKKIPHEYHPAFSTR